MEAFDEKELEVRLQRLAAWKRIAFMAQVGMRMLPNYERFSAETGFGDASVLRRTLDAAWSWVESGKPPSDLTTLREACEKQAPDTERFRSRYTSAALDAANAAVAILDAIERPDEARPEEVASLARDTIDLFVQELMDLDPNAPNFENAVLRHDLMQRELRRQREDLETLATWLGERSTAGRELRGTWAKTLGSLQDS
jgi:uncharacterized protein YjaG (DUF416 family)